MAIFAPSVRKSRPNSCPNLSDFSQADIFWFSLFHEIGHILLHPKKTFIDDDQVRPELARQEKEADQFAADSLIGAEKLCEFMRKADLSHEAIETFAREVGISAGIVAGRLQHGG